MEFFRIKRDIPFMRHALVFNAISFITFAAAVFFLITRGLHLSVEFTGGTLMEVSYSQPADLNAVRAQISKLGFTDVQVQNFGTARDVMIRLPSVKGRCRFTGLSRSGLVAVAKAAKAFISVRLPGRVCGAVLIDKEKLTAYLRNTTAHEDGEVTP